MAAAGPRVRRQSSVSKMLSVIVERRNRNEQEAAEFVVIESTSFWTQLFKHHFVESIDELRDDMLFYVRKREEIDRDQVQVKLDVFRRDAKILPSLGDPDIDWEQSVYLNLILQQFEYTLTCAICRKPGKDIHVIKKHSQSVYASPSKRQMDSKGEVAEVAYPNIYFIIDNFDEAFGDMMIEEGQMVCVELVAQEKLGTFQGVIFLGSVRYEALRRVYEGRASMASRIAQRMSLGKYTGRGRMEFIRMKGPEGKGHAEMAVSRYKPDDGHDSYYSSDENLDSQGASPLHRPRAICSQPASASSSPPEIRKSLSYNDNLAGVQQYQLPSGYSSDQSSSPEDEGWDEFESKASWVGDNSQTSNWRSRLGQSLNWLRRSPRKPRTLNLNTYLTYVTLPWHRIIADILEVRQLPIITHNLGLDS
ncbi:uncharacterized protein KIAA0930 homolog [Saccoglossus kowalevskii]|uniref:Uncharacterized protein KIAA0930 homolog n=1 Tax=Saccoglossus kowalevskii TaxID=10224 RepID=A0ABM0MVT4_SACKO|nr:PREDICTED: uncharacterized protein KIAA0930 homolog [Saccoglossus kowalevskii]